MTTLVCIAAAGTIAAVAYMSWEFLTAPLVDENERMIDEVQDDPRPAQVLREGQRGVRL